MHSWNTVPENWESLGPPPAGTTINLYVVLRPHGENVLIEALHEVSSPGNPKHVFSPLLHACTYSRILPCYRYGAHLSKEQAAVLVLPHPDTLELVDSWLKYHDVLSSSVSVTHSGYWLTLTGVSVAKANDILGASYQHYRHAETNETIVRTVGYSLPAALQAHVQTVAPTTYFASPRMLWQTPRKRRSREAAAGLKKAASGEIVSGRDDNEVTPTFLRWLYSTFYYQPAVTNRNVLGIAGYIQGNPSPADLSMFMDQFLPEAADAAFTVVQVNGGGNNLGNSLQANYLLQHWRRGG
jgi:tripeptidyl-peptidase-1